jgi:ATP-binding cassette, subfamily B, bacterial
VINEVLGSIRVVKSFGQEDNERDRFSGQANKAVKGQLQVAKTGAVFYFFVGMIFAVATALFIFIGSGYVKSGEMTLGELTLVIAYLAQIYGPIEKITKNVNDIQSSVTSLDRVFALLDIQKEVKEEEHPHHITQLTGSFQFRNVSFCYDQNKPILDDISFELKPGDRVGIVGSTGAGKSTLASLLTRFYDPSTGSITVDGRDIRNYKLTEYRKLFGIVLQEPVLFSTTIAENIAYGRPNASMNEIIQAAKNANAHEFIIRCTEGYNTRIGERGMQLSGGERQRLSLARAFIKDAPVLILDEPTSSVDVYTEAQIMQAMERLMKGRNTFLITHRLDTLQLCNVILHLEHGKIVKIIRDPGASYTFVTAGQNTYS